MRVQTDAVLDRLLSRGAAYADLRIVRRHTEAIDVKNGAVEGIARHDSAGFGVRVLAGGAWGFASSSQIEPEELEKQADLALAIARASARVRGPEVRLAPAEPAVDRWQVRCKVDPFEVPLQRKIDLLLDAEKRLHVGPAVRVGEAHFGALREQRTFSSTEGSRLEQEITECGGGISATAAGPGEVQRRGYPNAHRGHFSCQGYDFFQGLELGANAERVGQEACALLEAKSCPAGRADLLLDARQLALQIHESCGHPVELDRVLGSEAGYAGTSFLTPEKRGTFRYGSPSVSIVADGFLPTGLGTLKYDDEGVRTRRVVLIEEGIFRDYLTSRETAPQIGERASNGCMRADGWNRVPIIRMNNVSLEPGDWDLEELIRDTRDGLYLETNRSWSIDDRRLNFQFGTEIGWEIKDGALGAMVRNPNYTGLTPEFWGACDAVCGRAHWQLWGTPNCGKGEPGQVAHVGHGASPARFRQVRVGVGLVR